MRPALHALRVLRGSLVRCLGLMFVAGAIAASAHLIASRTADAQALDDAQREARNADVRNAEEHAQATRGNARYVEMAARGAIGPEHRADWLERISQARQALPIDVEFQISPQQPAAIGNSSPGAKRFQFMASTMKLQMVLAHEQDLLDFLDALGKSVSALLRIRSCKLARMESESASARLKADCVVDWITLREMT